MYRFPHFEVRSLAIESTMMWDNWQRWTAILLDRIFGFDVQDMLNMACANASLRVFAYAGV